MIGLSNLVPPVNQLTQPANDGGPDNNAQEDCTPAVLSWAIKQLTGRDVSADELKDAVYGAGYVGPTAFGSFARLCEAWGVGMTATIGLSPADMATHVSSVLSRGHCAGVAIASDWGNNPPHATTTHSVCIVQQEAFNGMFTAMNPWGGFWQKQPVAWWVERFRLGAVYELAPLEQSSMWTIERDGAGNITGARDAHGAAVGAGMAAEIAASPSLVATNAVLGEQYFASGQSLAVLTSWQWLDWFASRGNVQLHADGGAVVAALYNLTASAARRISDLTAQLASVQAADAAEEAAEASSPPADPNAEALVSALKKALGLAA